MAIIDPASDAAREVRDLVSQARCALQDSETSGPDRSLATTKSVYYLATAIDKLINETLIFNSKETPVVDLQLDTYGPKQLEDLYESITKRTSGLDYLDGQSSTPGQRKFVISFPDVELSIREIWPEGDAPDYPTPEDVVEVMKVSRCATPDHIVKEWELLQSLYVRDSDDENGITEVEWDGS